MSGGAGLNNGCFLAPPQAAGEPAFPDRTVQVFRCARAGFSSHLAFCPFFC